MVEAKAGAVEGAADVEKGGRGRRDVPVSSPRFTTGLFDLYEPLEDGRDVGRGGESGVAR